MNRIALLGLMGCIGCAHTPQSRSADLAVAPYVEVHLDRLDPAKVGQFEQGRREWLAAVAQQKGTDPWWGARVEVPGLGFYTLRPVQGLGDLRTAVPNLPATAERAAAVSRYDQMSDEGLIFPHHTQIWEAERELSFQPLGRAISLTGAGHGWVVLEGIAPTRVGDYIRAVKQMHQALAQANYPLARFTFSSEYGDGRTVSFWLGTEEHPPDLETALQGAVGAARAAEILKAIRDCVVTTETYPARTRPELSTASGMFPQR